MKIKQQNHRFPRSALLAVVLLGLFLGFMALRSPSPLKAPRIVASSIVSNSLFFAGNREFSVSLGERNTNKPVIEYSLPAGNKISFSYRDIKGKQVAPESKGDTVTFKDVSPNLDLKYTTLPTGLKEEIILKKQAINNVFTFDLNTTKASPQVQTDSLYSSTFYDSNGNYLFHFEKPFAVDANGQRTDNVAIQIRRNTKTNAYSLTLTVDRPWLESSNRVFPIVVDPTIVHDTTVEFATAQFNRVKDIGTGFITGATGGTITYTNGYTIHTFTEDGTFTPGDAGNVEYLVIAGGGGGGNNAGAGGGAGGYREGTVAVTAQGYNITVGGGGGGSAVVCSTRSRGADGSNSVFSSITATGGGGGACGGSGCTCMDGRVGGSGGGSSAYNTTQTGGAGTAGQGQKGSNTTSTTNGLVAGGGGGAGGAASNISQDGGTIGAVGGTGITSSITGTSVTRASGGSGSYQSTATPGGGGASGVAGTANTGGGGGAGAAGGSGIVIVRYPTGPSLATNYQELPSDINTVALWHLNEASGNALDSSGNGNTGTPTGTTVVAGLLGNARSFAGSSSHIITVTDSTNFTFGTGDFSIELWINPKSIAAGGNGYDGIMGTYVPNSNGFIFTTSYGNDGHIGWWNYTNGWIDTGVSLDLNTWQHLAVTRTNGTINIYKNGALINTTNNRTGNIDGDNLIIGGWHASYNYLNGNLDEIRISKGIARTPEEIKLDASVRPYSTYTSDVLDLIYPTAWNSFTWTATGLSTGDGETATASAQSSLVAQWNFNDTPSTATAVSGGSCGASCSGTLTSFSNTTAYDIVAGSGWTFNNRRWGAGALMFDGTDDFVNVSNSALDITGNITIEAWIYLTGGINGATNYHIVGRENYQVGGYMFRVDGATLRLDYRTSQSGASQNTSTSSNIIPQNQWTHVAIPRDGSLAKIYVNGVDRTAVFGSHVNPASISLDTKIGASAPTASQFFKGTIDSTRIYNRALTASEISANYNAGRIDLQTRVGNTATPNDGTWELWKPITGESVITNMDTDMENWTVSTSTVSGLPVSTQNTNPTAPSGPTGCTNNRPILINNLGNSSVQTNYQVKLNIAYIAGMDASFADLRFTNASGTNLDYWLESHTDSVTAIVWVEVDSIPANASKYIYLWYNSCSGGNSSNGTNTMVLFDDFEDGSINAMWSFQGLASYTESFGSLNLDANTNTWSNYETGAHVSISPSISNYHAHADVEWVGLEPDLCQILLRSKTTGGTSAGYVGIYDAWAGSSPGIVSVVEGGQSYTTTSDTQPLSGRKNFDIYHNSNTYNLYFDNRQILIGTGSSSSNEIVLTNTRYTTYAGKTAKYHLFWLRKYTSPEPTANLIVKPVQPYIEGSGSLKLSLGVPQVDTNTVALWHLDETNSPFSANDPTSGMLSQSGLTAFTAANCVDNNTGTNAWHTDSSVPGAYLAVDLGVGNEKAYILTRIYSASTYIGNYSVQYSDNGSAWTTVATNFIPNGAGWWQKSWQNVGSHRYWRYYLTNTPGGGAWLNEMEWYTAAITDATSNGNHGIPTGTTVANGFSGKARSFNTSSWQYISSGAPSPYTNLTLEAWVKPNSLTGGSDGYHTIIVGVSGYYLSLYNDGSVQCYWYGTSPAGYHSSGAGTVSIGQWSHIACAWDGSNIRIYVNGILKNTVAVTGTGNAATSLNFGAESSGRQFDGLIDEVRISNVARSAEEIAESYRAGRDHYINRTISSTDLSGKTTLPFYVASDRQGTFLNATIGESAFANYQSDANTVGLWHLEENYTVDGSISVKAGKSCSSLKLDGVSSSGIYWVDSDGAGAFAPVQVYCDMTTDGGGWTLVLNNSSGSVVPPKPTWSQVVSSNNTTGTFGTDLTVFDQFLGVQYWNILGNQMRVMQGSTPTNIAHNATYTFSLNTGNNYALSMSNESILVNTGGTASPGIYTYHAAGNYQLSTYDADHDVSAGNCSTSYSNTAWWYGACWSGNYWGGGDADGYTNNPYWTSSTTEYLAWGGIWIRDSNAAPDFLFKDSSGNANNGQSVGTTLIQGKIGKARSFNGTSDYIRSNASGSLTGNYTVDMWVNPVANTGNPELISTRAPSEFGLDIQLSTTGLHGDIGNGVGWLTTGADATVNIPFGSWTHVAYVVTSTSWTIYVNGAVVNSGTYASGTPLLYDSTHNIFLGTYNGASNFYSGKMDEVRISNTARTADQIRQAYEIGARTHNITIDFKASLGAGNLITGVGDLGFTVDETAFGSYQAASHLFLGDKIIVKENYDGTEYIAQGTVNAVNSSTGAVTVASWDTGSTFPSGGYTVNATVFKWQREYFNLTGTLCTAASDVACDRYAVTNLTLRVTDGSQGSTVWLDDFRSNSSYLNDPVGSTITSSLNNRYFQYRAILSQNDISTTPPALTSVSLDYTKNEIPNLPTLDLPGDTATNQNLLPVLKTTATDNDAGEILKYKINLCLDSGMSTGCKTFDQTVTGTGWSAASYVTGTQAVYTVQTADILTANTVYYWKSLAIDPAGRNTWGATQTTPYSFTTTHVPAPTSLLTNGVANNPAANIANIYFSATHTDPDSDTANYYRIEVNTNNSFTGTVMWDSTKTAFGTPVASGATTPNITYAGSGLTTSTTYYWRLTLWDSNHASAVSGTAQFTTNTVPNLPTLDLPTNTATNQNLLTVLKTTATDNDATDVLKYRINLCTNVGMTLGCKTFDQTVTGTGWSAGSYTQGVQAVYTIQPADILTASTTYYWKSLAIDQAGSNTWSATQTTPYSFTTTTAPSTPTTPYCEGSTNPSGIVDTTPEFSAIHNDSDSDAANFYQIEVNTQSDFLGTSMWDSTKTGMSNLNNGVRSTDVSYAGTALSLTGSTYYWHIRFWDINGATGAWSAPQNFTMNIKPNTPSLDLPANTATGQLPLPVLKTTATDNDAADILKYKINLCTNVGMTLGCKVFDQTVTGTGWSAASYTQGVQAIYTVQPADILTANTVYYWKSLAIDEAGSNTWSATQTTPYSFTSSQVPNTPSLDLPTDTATEVTLNAVLKTTGTDNDTGDILKYKINLCTNVGMTVGCKTFDQTSSATGWSAASYTQGVQAIYTIQPADVLTKNTVYYWKSLSKDEAGSNTWSATQTTPYSFTTKISSTLPSPCTTTKATDNSNITINWTDSATEDNYQVWKVTDGGFPAQLGGNLAPNTIQLVDSAVSNNHSYGYLIRGLLYDGANTIYSGWCTTSTTYLGLGFLNIDRLKLEGVKID